MLEGERARKSWDKMQGSTWKRAGSLFPVHSDICFCYGF